MALRLARSLSMTAARRAAAPAPTLTAAHLVATDAALKPLAATLPTYTKLASDAAIARAQAALQKVNHTVTVVGTNDEALKTIKALIPAGASVYSTSSISLAEIGYIQYAMGGNLPYRNMNAAVQAERDPKKQAALRAQAAISDVVLSSPVAVTEAGDILVVDASGTRVGPVLVGGQTVFLVGANKVVPTYEDAMRRLHEYTYPLESARMRAFYNMPKAQSTIANVVNIKHGNIMGPSRTHLVIVKQSLGY